MSEQGLQGATGRHVFDAAVTRARQSNGFPRGRYNSIEHFQQARRALVDTFGSQRGARDVRRSFRPLSLHVLRAEQSRGLERRTRVPSENADQIEILQVERAVIGRHAIVSTPMERSPNRTGAQSSTE